MESILLAKNKCESKKMWNVNQRKHIHNNLLSKINISHTIKIEKFDHQDWTDFFWIRTDFSLPGWTGSYIFGYLNAKFQPLGSYIVRFLFVGFTVIQKGSSVRGTLTKRRGFNKRRNLDTSSFFILKLGDLHPDKILVFPRHVRNDWSAMRIWGQTMEITGAPNENIVQNHLNIALLNLF